MTFKIGQRVKLVAHAGDSSANLEIGATGVVKEITDNHKQTTLVEWDGYQFKPNWWVQPDILKRVVVTLENK